MATATVAFRKCVINSQEYGGDDKHLASRVFFDLDIEGEGYANLYVDVRQSKTTDLKEESLEISGPYGYDGPFNCEVFQASLEFYYRQVIGEKGAGWDVLIGGPLQFEGWTIEQEMLVQFEVAESERGWQAP